MKRNVVLGTTLAVLFLLMAGCAFGEEEPLPTLVPPIQLPAASESDSTGEDEPGLPLETAAPPAEESIIAPTSPPVNFAVSGAIIYINSAGEGLFLTRPNGSEQTQYYALQNIDKLLPASFNGQRIGFIQENRLHIARTDGSGTVEITAVDQPSWLSWSPTRDEFTLIDKGDLVVVQADSGTVDRLTSGMQLADIPGSVDWSPDGTQLLFTCGSLATDLCRVAREGSTAVVNITNNGAESLAWYREPSWSPDGRQISYVSPDENKDLQIFVMDGDGSDRRQLTSGSGQNSLHSWSPDGTRIAFSNFAEGEWHALAVAVESGEVVALTGDLPQLSGVVPQWDQEGLQVSLYYSLDGVSDAVNIALVTLADTAVTPITENGWQLQWSAEGGQIAYISGGAQIYVRGLSAGGVGTPAIITCPSGCESFVWLP